jgi:hypothetical protein
MERIAVVDFPDDRESVALWHTGPDPDTIYADIQSAFEAEGFDTITLFETSAAEVAHINLEGLAFLPHL